MKGINTSFESAACSHNLLQTDTETTFLLDIDNWVEAIFILSVGPETTTQAMFAGSTKTHIKDYCILWS